MIKRTISINGKIVQTNLSHGRLENVIKRTLYPENFTEDFFYELDGKKLKAVKGDVMIEKIENDKSS